MHPPDSLTMVSAPARLLWFRCGAAACHCDCKDGKREKAGNGRYNLTAKCSKIEPSFWEVFWGLKEHFAAACKLFRNSENASAEFGPLGRFSASKCEQRPSKENPREEEPCLGKIGANGLTESGRTGRTRNVKLSLN